jgi:spoIIIJ-associated protein
MDVLEISAKTVEDAIEQALDEMGVTRNDVKITVLSEGKAGGLFGFGAEDARVRVERIAETLPAPAASITKVAAETLDKILKLLEVEGEVVTGEYPDESSEPNTAPVAFNIEGDDLGILIGRRGQTLAALQYILRLIVGNQTKTWVPIVVDAEGYKKRRRDALKALALRMADHVKTKGSPFTLEPMPPYERRIVHLTLADHPAVYTESIGEGESRKVVIRPKQRSGGSPRNDAPASPRNHAPDHRESFQRDSGYGQRGGYGGGQRNNYPRPRRPQSPY